MNRNLLVKKSDGNFGWGSILTNKDRGKSITSIHLETAIYIYTHEKDNIIASQETSKTVRLAEESF